MQGMESSLELRRGEIKRLQAFASIHMSAERCQAIKN